MYFDSCNTEEECRVRYRELAKVMHPDLGGCEEDFKAMREEYEAAVEELTHRPEWLKDEYIELGKAACGLARNRYPEGFKKTAAAVNAIADLLSLSHSRHAKNIRSYINRIEI